MKKLFFYFLLFFSIIALNAQSCIAQEIDQDSSILMSAEILDFIPPTKPILLTPEKNSLLRNKPIFSWKASSDVNGIKQYIFLLNNLVVFNNLIPDGENNTQYGLTFNSETQTYALNYKNNLDDGEYSFKITAIDFFNNQNTSEIWLFSFDTTPPDFIIDQIDNQILNISAKDTITTHPTLIFKDNNLIIKASSEQGSIVDLMINNQSGTIISNINGTTLSQKDYQVSLGILPREQILTLNFTITDNVGNISTLNGVNIMIEKPKIVIPPSAVESIQTKKPEKKTITSKIDENPIVIPFTPIDEVLFDFGKKINNIIPKQVKQFAQKVITDTMATTIEVAKDMAPIAVPVAMATTTSFSLLSLIAQLAQFSDNLWIHFLQALGLIKVSKKKGFVFDCQTFKPIPFAFLTIISQNKTNPFKETIITDIDGFYHGFKLPMGKYKINVIKPGYTFPIEKNQQKNLSLGEYYFGDDFSISSEEEIQSLIIPLNPKQKSEQQNWNEKFKVWIQSISINNKYAFRLIFMFSFAMIIYFPTKWNLGFFSLYLLFFAKNIINSLRIPLISGLVTDENGTPLPNVLVKITFINNNDLANLIFTNKKGKFHFYGKKDQYQINVIKNNYVYYQEKAIMSLFFVDATSEKHNFAFVMVSNDRIAKDFFTQRQLL